MKFQYYAGIDQGVEGCVTIFDTSKEGTDDAFKFIDMPTTVVQKKNGGQNKIYLIHQLIQILPPYKDNLHVTMEELHGRPMQAFPGARQTVSGVTLFNQGMSTGIWRCHFVEHRIPFNEVSPQTWKKEMLPGVGNKADKEAVRLFVCNRYPSAAKYLSLKKHHNRAEALLLSLYGRELNEG